MAKIVHLPDTHDCRGELSALPATTPTKSLPHPVGTVAECSCGQRFVFYEDQCDGAYWTEVH